MLVPFPIAFFVATFGCDLAYWQTSNAAWATGAICCLVPVLSWPRSPQLRVLSMFLESHVSESSGMFGGMLEGTFS